MKRLLSSSIALLLMLQTPGAFAMSVSMDTAMPLPSLILMPLEKETPVTRMQLVTMLLTRVYPEADFAHCLTTLPSSPDSRYTLLFADVKRSDDHAPELCVAMRAGIVSGYPDGTFHPERVVTVAEAAKMIVKAGQLTPPPGQMPKTLWYGYAMDALRKKGSLPAGTRPAAVLTGGLLSQLLASLPRPESRPEPMKTEIRDVRPPVGTLQTTDIRRGFAPIPRTRH